MLTFAAVPGRETDEYVRLDGVFLGRVYLDEAGWGYVENGGRRRSWKRYRTHLGAGHALELRYLQRAGDRETRANAMPHDRRARRLDLLRPGVM